MSGYERRKLLMAGFLLYPPHSHDLQLQLLYQRKDIVPVFRGDVLLNLEKDRIDCRACRGFGGIACLPPFDEQVGDVDVGGVVGGGGVAEDEVGDGDGEVGAFGGFAAPGFDAVDVGKGHDVAAPEDFDAVVHLGFAAGGEPEEVWTEDGGDDGGLLRLDESDGLVGVSWQEVFSEKALGECPAGREHSLPGKQGVHPGDGRGSGGVFDAVAGERVIFHHLACAAAAPGVYLVEDHGSASGESELIFIDGPGDVLFGGYGAKEAEEVAAGLKSDGAAHYVRRDGADIGSGLDVPRRGRNGLVPEGVPGDVFVPGLAPVPLAWRIEAVAAGGFVVAASVFLYIHGTVVGIDIGGEAVLASAGGAGVAGADAGVFEQVVAVVHTLSYSVIL